MRFSRILLTLVFVAQCQSFQVQQHLPAKCNSRCRNNVFLRMVKEHASAMDTILYFNREFKAGLKFVLIPQDKLKESAKAAQTLKNQAMVPDNVEIEYGPVDPTYLSRVETFSSQGYGTQPESNNVISDTLRNIPKSMPTIEKPDVDSIFSESLSIPDITILKETLAKALPDKSPIEISEMTKSLVQITTSVQERTQQMIDTAAIANMAKDMPDVSGMLNEKYQQLIPVVSDATKDATRVLQDSLQASQDAGQVFSQNFGEKYLQNQQLVGENYQQLSQLAGQNIQQVSKYTSENIQQASRYAKESIEQVSKVANEGFQKAQQFTQEETKYLAGVANDNYKQAQPYIDEAKTEVTRRINEQYDIVQPYMQQAVKEISTVLDEKYQQAVPLLKDLVDISYERSEKYQKAIVDILAVDSEPSKILADLKQRIIANADVYQLQYRTDHLPDINYVPTVPYDKLDAVFDSLTLLVQTDGWTLTDLIQNINLEELGGFYGGCIVGTFLVASLVTKSKTPPMIFTPTPKRQQQPSIGGQQESESAMYLTEEKVRLERLVSDLTLAVTALSKELRDLKEEKAKTDYALATMKSDVRMLQNAIQATDLTEGQLQKQTIQSEIKQYDLQTHLRDAEMQVQALQTEKELLQLEINDLMTTGEVVVDRQSMEPKPPSTIPPTMKAKKNDKDVWFANFVST
jgi:hypothetical protein